MFKGYELVVILVLVLLLFGAKRLPDTARGLGRALRILKAETRGLREDDEKPATSGAAPSTDPAAEQPQTVHQPPLALRPSVAPAVADDVPSTVTPGDSTTR